MITFWLSIAFSESLSGVIPEITGNPIASMLRYGI